MIHVNDLKVASTHFSNLSLLGTWAASARVVGMLCIYVKARAADHSLKKRITSGGTTWKSAAGIANILEN